MKNMPPRNGSYHHAKLCWLPVLGLVLLCMSVRGAKPPGKFQLEVLSREATSPETNPEKIETATLAGGCFWGIQLAFQRIPGVLSTKVGCVL
jgi:hypothetical protein